MHIISNKWPEKYDDQNARTDSIYIFLRTVSRAINDKVFPKQV